RLADRTRRLGGTCRCAEVGSEATIWGGGGWGDRGFFRCRGLRRDRDAVGVHVDSRLASEIATRRAAGRALLREVWSSLHGACPHSPVPTLAVRLCWLRPRAEYST